VRIAKLKIDGFRGIRSGEFRFGEHAALVGPNGSGKSTVVDALSLVLGKGRLVRALTEHDFRGSNPAASDRFRIVVTLTGFPTQEFEDYPDWFRDRRGVPKWLDAGSGNVFGEPADGRELCIELGFAARFDASTLTVETIRYFHDDDANVDAFDDDDVRVTYLPPKLLEEVGYFVLPARRTWDAVASFGSELFRRTVTAAGGIPSDEILRLRDTLRAPSEPLENAVSLRPMVESMNAQLARLFPEKPRFQLRVTSGDSEAVLAALLPHFQLSDGTTLPVSRQGSGLVALQVLLLLLEIGRARKQRGAPFILILEEPELHLAPGVQARVIAEAKAVATQTICTTHSPAVAAVYTGTEIQVMDSVGGATSCRPLVESALSPDASSKDRALFVTNRGALVEALMSAWVLVPEGRLDFEWLRRLSFVADAQASDAPPFGAVFGILPTKDAAIEHTVEQVKRLRRRVAAVVDGDQAGDGYASRLLSLRPDARPDVVIQWSQVVDIEDVVLWVLEGGGTEAVDAVVADLSRWVPMSSSADLRSALHRTHKDGGLKDDLLAHEALTAVIAESLGCLKRAVDVLNACVSIVQAREHPLTQQSGTASLVRVRLC
jgi:putative ATP-dependent endonuclease of the OLD family